MKYQEEVARRNRRTWIGLNLIPILAMVVSLVFPLPVVQAQGVEKSGVSLSAPVNSHFLGNKKPLTCAEGDHCALYFNGVNQWVEENQFRGFDTSSFTLETWVNWSGDGKPISGETDLFQGVLPIIAIGEGSESATSIPKLIFGIDSGSRALFTGFQVKAPDGTNDGEYHSLAGSTVIAPDTWHHIAAVFDGQVLRLYLDGNLDAEQDLGEPVLPDLFNVHRVTLAAADPQDTERSGFFKGSIDEVRIWEVARTQTELLSGSSQENISDPNLLGYWVMNEGKGSEVKDSSGKGKQGAAQNDPVWSDGAPMMLSASPLLEALPTADAAPGTPTLVSPLDGSTNVSTAPSLNVNVSDTDGGNLTVTYYGKAASTPQPDFTFIILPDTQKYSTSNNGIFELQTQWVVSQLAQKNIVFVGHLGDAVDDWNVPDQWAVPDEAMGTLENAGIPYAIAPGNCDLDHYGVPPDTTFFNTYFPVSRFAGRSYYGGAYNNDNANSYQLISASGLNFIIIDLKYNISYNTTQGQAILAWANNLLQVYSNRKAIVITHNLLTTSNIFSTDGSMIFNALKGNPNLFLMLGGHLDTEGMRVDQGTDGHTIYSLRSDYQTRANGGNGWLRIMRFSPGNNKIFVTTYSPYLNQFETDADSQFSLDYSMGGTGFDVIGSTTVPSGSTATIAWSGLSQQTQYQWYVTVNDGTTTTTSATWSFTTGSGQSAPVVTTQPVDLTVNSGQTATFTAAASGSPTPTVQWQVSADHGSTWNNIAGATSAVYSFTAQSSDNGKQFKALFTNTYGSVSTNAANLTVNTPPVVTTQPSSLIVTSGQTASFTAAASGVPTPSVQWQVSTNGTTWTNVSGATTTTYSFTTVPADNGKQFKAVFTNAAGSAMTNAAVLTVQTPPAVTTQPSSQTISAGQVVNFTAAASGFPPPTVQWQVSLDGASWSNISGATSTTYSFTATSGDNGKQFHAVFSNSVGSATSSAAILTVNTAPVITLHPSNLTVISGQTASFTAAASGIPSPAVQWQVSTDGGSTWGNIAGATSPTYTLTTAILDNGKQFRAVFTNTAGSANTNSAILTVNFAPSIITQPSNQSVNAGQTAAFTAAASGNPTPSVQWQVSIDGVLWTNIAGATSTTYSFVTAAGDNGKQFHAVFSNSVGTAISAAAVLTVRTAPTITLNPVNLTVNAGQAASFTSAASGSPAPSVQWQVSVNGTDWNNISGANSPTYSFISSSTDNAKQFRAVFTNPAGSATTTPAVLTVQTPPVVVTQPSSQTVNSGQMVTFTAAASGSPTPTIQWQVSPNGSVWSDIAGATSSPLNFTALAGDDAKQYRAVFTNAAGSATSTAVILTVHTLPLVTLQPVSQTVVEGKSVSFTSAASGNPAPTIQWQSSPDGIVWSNITGAAAATYSFTPAASDNGKQFRTVFTNSVGSATTSPASLTVQYGPSVTSQPADQSLLAGQTATFSASAVGNPNPTVHWEVSTDGFTWSDLPGETSTTLTFTSQISDNGKRYRAYFINPVSEVASASALLTVTLANVPPAVTLHPVNQTVNAGQTVVFSAGASGTPAPTVQWQVSANGTTWTDIPSATAATYSFTANGGDNGMHYRAVFTNIAGSATSNAAVLTVYTAPVVINQPTSLTVNAGQTAAFTAAASGNPTPTVQWQVSADGSSWSNIAGAVAATYSFTAQASDNGKQYRAVFSNSAGNATSNAAMLTVYTAPVITTQPVSQTVTAGQTVTFSADASGNPSPAVQWQSSADNGATWANIPGAISKSYSFTSTAGDHARQFRAVFTNAAGSATTSAALLSVNTQPVISLQPSNLTVNVGQTASFTAAATGNPVPTIQWQSSSDGSNWSNINGATSTTYSFTAQAADNGKQFRAIFTNAAGSETSSTAVLTVQNAPQVTSQPADQTVDAGLSASFTASASGYPTPTVQWQKSTDGLVWTNIPGANSATYLFTTQVTDNGAHFRAVFTNAVGTATTSAAILTVQYPPAVTLHPVSQSVNATQNVTFSAAANGNPAPAVQWQLSTNGGSTWTNITGATSTSYTFTPSSADDGNQYRAGFSNSVGNATSNAAVLTVNFAPQVTTQPVSQTVSAGQIATFSSAASGKPVPSVQWQVSSDGINWSNITGATSTTYTFTTQAADNGKQFRAVFTNSVGSATSNSALLSVMNDLIFADAFNTCNPSAWNGGALNLSRLAFNTASGRNSTCGMAVAVANGIMAYVTDNTPTSETTYNARFYFRPNTLKMPNNTPITLIAGRNASGDTVVSVQLRWSGNSFQMRAGSLSDTGSWSYTSWASFTNAWHSVEVDWQASSSSTANDGSLVLLVDGVQRGSLSNLNNDVHSIESVSLGSVAGVTNKMSGSFFMDDFESRRVSVIGQ